MPIADDAALDRARSLQRLTLITVCAALFANTMDTAGFSASAVSLAKYLSLGSFASTAVFGAYTLSLSTSVIVAGSLADRIGRRHVITAGALALVVATILTSIATGGIVLIAARFVAGGGAGFIIVASLAAIPEAFPEEQRTRAYALATASASTAYLVAPVLSSVLVSQDGWRLLTLALVPIYVATAFLAQRLPESRPHVTQPLDVVGCVLAFLAACAVTGTSVLFTRTGISGWAFLVLGVTAVVTTGFVGWERRVSRRSDASPVMPMRLFRHRNLSAAIAAAALGGFAWSMSFVLVMNLSQYVVDRSAIATQLLLIPATVAGIVGALLSARVDKKWGSSRAIATGFFIAAAAYLTMASVPEAALWVSFVALIVLGFGSQMTISPVNKVIVSSVDESDQGVAVGTTSAVKYLASTVTLSIVSGIFANKYASALHGQLANAGLDQVAGSAEHQSIAAVGGVEQTLGGHNAPTAQTFSDLVTHAFLNAQRFVMLLGAVCAIAGALVAWFLIRDRSRRSADANE